MSTDDSIFDIEAALEGKPEAKLFDEIVEYIGTLELLIAHTNDTIQSYEVLRSHFNPPENRYIPTKQLRDKCVARIKDPENRAAFTAGFNADHVIGYKGHILLPGDVLTFECTACQEPFVITYEDNVIDDWVCECGNSDADLIKHSRLDQYTLPEPEDDLNNLGMPWKSK